MNRRSPKLVTAPASEPVSLDEMKLFLKVDGSDEDALITSLIATARRACENYTQRAFISQTWRLTMDRFGDRDYDAGLPDGFSLGPSPHLVSGQQAIQLARQPIQSITHVKTTDSANQQTTVDAGVYTLDATGGRVLLNEGKSWPYALRDEAAVEIATVNGYGDAAAVPEDIKMAIKLYAAAMYGNRACADMPDGCKAMLAPYMSAEAFAAW